MKKILVLLIFIYALDPSLVSAQRHNSGDTYNSAIGVKYYPGAISFKQNLFNDNYLEAIAYAWKGTRITALYELHYELQVINGLSWYVGPGLHIAYYDKNNYSGSSRLGIDGVLGLDLKINNAPLNFSLDWQPSFEFVDKERFNGDFLCLGVRFVLK